MNSTLIRSSRISVLSPNLRKLSNHTMLNSLFGESVMSRITSNNYVFTCPLMKHIHSTNSTCSDKPKDKAPKSEIKRTKTPIGKLDELEEGKHPYQEKEPLPPFPDNTNPETGEIGGPRGPEPTRYGDWERKGRVTDF